MGSPSGGADSSSGPSGGGDTGGGGPSGSDNDNDSGGPSGSDNDNDNDRGGPSGSDNDNDNDRGKTSGSDSTSESSESGMTGSERAAAAFDNAMSNAAKGPEEDDDEDDEAAATAASESDHANEFSGLGPSGGPTATGADEHANEFDGLGPSDGTLSGDDSRNSHRGFGPDETHPSGIDVQGRLDELDQQIADQKANDDRYSSLYDTRDTPNVNTPENPTDLDSVPPAQSVVYSADTSSPPATTPEDIDHDFATDASAAAAVIDALGTAAAAYPDSLTPGALDALKSASKVAKAVGPAAETLEATLNADPDERVKSGAEGFVSSLDDLAVGLGIGAAVGTFSGNPPAGAVAGAGAAIAYDNSPPDKAFDEGVQAAGDMIEDGIDTTKEGIRDFERSLIDRALSEARRRAGNR